jgi:uncharacterized protein
MTPTLDLNDSEVDELDRLLEEVGANIDVSGLDGHVCAVAVQPSPIEEGIWLAAVLGEGNAEPAARSRIAALARRLHAARRRAIVEDGVFDPLVFGFDASHPLAVSEYEPQARLPPVSQALMPWVAGFRGADEAFGSLQAVDDESVPGLLERLYRHLPPEDALQREVPTLPEGGDPLDGLDAAIDDLVAAVVELADRSYERRYRVETVRRAQPKVGRNDPCPCGSGRKYKVCHGVA